MLLHIKAFLIKAAKFNLNSSIQEILFSILTQLHVIVCNILINCSSKSLKTRQDTKLPELLFLSITD